MGRIHFIVLGFVQGIGYRKFVKHIARTLGIMGWVRNNHDGSVEVVAIGEKEKLEKLIAACKKGPFLAQVDNVHVEWEDQGEQFTEFSVRHD